MIYITSGLFIDSFKYTIHVVIIDKKTIKAEKIEVNAVMRDLLGLGSKLPHRYRKNTGPKR